MNGDGEKENRKVADSLTSDEGQEDRNDSKIMWFRDYNSYSDLRER